MTDENQPQIHVSNRAQPHDENVEPIKENVPAIIPDHSHPHGELVVNANPPKETPAQPVTEPTANDYFVVTNISSSNLTTTTNPLQVGHHIIVDTKAKNAMVAAYGSAALSIEPLNEWLVKETEANAAKQKADKEASDKLAQENEAKLAAANAAHEEQLKTLPPANTVSQTQHVPSLRNPALNQPGHFIDNTNKTSHVVVGEHPTQSDMIAGVAKSPMMIFPTRKAPILPAQSTPVTVPIPQAQIPATRPGIIGTDKTTSE